MAGWASKPCSCPCTCSWTSGGSALILPLRVSRDVRPRSRTASSSPSPSSPSEASPAFAASETSSGSPTLTVHSSSSAASTSLCRWVSSPSQVSFRRQRTNPIIAGLPWTVAFGQVAPGSTGSQSPKDAVYDPAVVTPLFALAAILRQEWGDLSPCGAIRLLPTQP